LLATPAGAQQLDVASIDRYVATVMSEWKVPGLSIGIIREGQVILAKGYGFRDVEQQLPMTPRTLLAIGSNTKSFTVVLLSMLADAGKLDFEKPVRDYLPDFQLHDEYAAREMTPRDLLSHVSGLPRHDLLWFGRNTTRKEIYQRLKYLEPTTTFRGRLQYNNLMFIAAGELAERVGGHSWDDQVRDRIFTPLGMTRASTTPRDLEKSDDFSRTYGLVDGKVARIPVNIIDNAGPAGSIVASIEDMLKYVQFHIDSGRVGGRQLMSARSETRMTTPVVPAPGLEGDFAELEPTTYALGLAVTSFRGHRLVIHGGGIDGFISQMSWLPRERIGIVVLTNYSGTGDTPIPTFITYQLYDMLLGLPPIDWKGRYARIAVAEEAEAASARQARAATRKAGTRPSHRLADLAGTYEHPGYGRVVIESTGDGLRLSIDRVRATLRHYHYDVFELVDSNVLMPMGPFVRFLTDGKGEVDRVLIPVEPAQDGTEFKKVR
jgi:CubicO group peptidase (beta-lactamase class C family)